MQIALIAKTLVKTDPRDALTRARLLAAGILPNVWVPPVEVRELRALGGHRSRLIKQRTQARNRLRAVLFAHNLFPPPGEAFGPANRGWWKGLELPASEKLRVRQDLSILDNLEPLIKEVEAELVRQSNVAPWAEQAAYLVQLPGIGVHNAMLLLAAIGDIRRFDAAHKLVGYAGLAPGCTARARRTAAVGLPNRGDATSARPWLKPPGSQLEAIATGRSCSKDWRSVLATPKAIVAIARKLLLVVWHVLTKHVADREAIAEKVAGKFLEWSWKLGRG